MKKTWTLELDHDETIALARAMHLMMEHCRLGLVEDGPTTLANLMQIIRKFVDEDEFAAITPVVVEEAQS